MKPQYSLKIKKLSRRILTKRKSICPLLERKKNAMLRI